MAPARARNFERNEVAWWSNWAGVTWFGRSAWLLMSERFPEYFLNRGGFLECYTAGQKFRDIESKMTKHGLTPHFFVQDSCGETIKLMLDSGYRVVDGMAIMSPGRVRLQKSGEVKVEVASGAGLEDWSKAYLRSFYGDFSLMPAVTEVVQSLKAVRRATLLIGRIEGKVAGVLALFRSSGLLGVYCVGTVPEFRRRGVAVTMLESAQSVGISENRQVILQTILSDGYEHYYAKRGFKRLYLKTLLKKETFDSKNQRV